MVPKIVVCLLINRAKEEIQPELVQRLFATVAGRSDMLLRESEEVAAQRAGLTDRLSRLREAAEVLQELREAGPYIMGGPGGVAGGAAAAAVMMGSSSPAAHAHHHHGHHQQQAQGLNSYGSFMGAGAVAMASSGSSYGSAHTANGPDSFAYYNPLAAKQAAAAAAKAGGGQLHHVGNGSPGPAPDKLPAKVLGAQRRSSGGMRADDAGAAVPALAVPGLAVGR